MAVEVAAAAKIRFLAPVDILRGVLIHQNHLPMRWRFPASALFSALMAVYYALSAIWFG